MNINLPAFPSKIHSTLRYLRANGCFRWDARRAQNANYRSCRCFDKPVSILMKLLAIRLGCQKTTVKSLVMSKDSAQGTSVRGDASTGSAQGTQSVSNHNGCIEA